MNKRDFRKFYQLHYQSKPLLLANAWNAKSAMVIENAGFDAIATSSGAIADSLGYKDGEMMPFDQVLYMVERIKYCTSLPMTVDLERGYAKDFQTLTYNIQRLINIGVSGINLEDTEGEDRYVAKLKCIKTYLNETGQHLFINARIDAFLQKLPLPLQTTLARAKRYQDAGADGLFVTGVQETDIIRQICSSTALPVNVVGVSKLASISTLAHCGVRRISMAGLLYNATYTRMRKLADEICKERSLAPLYL
jgi:2-methylisocitrate lyase-like PEP mutase family enzyme